MQNDDRKGLKDISHNSEEVARYYDEFATDYNATLSRWQYDVPQQVANILCQHCPLGAKILDVGCGTGLTGKALSDVGFSAIDGIDISEKSLLLAAESLCYQQLQTVDLQQFPYPIADGAYDAISCSGVLTYLPDSRGTLAEFCRLVKKGGLVVATQRTDLFAEREFDEVLNELQVNGMITELVVSEPRPYLPKQVDFTDKILAHYVQFVVA